MALSDQSGELIVNGMMPVEGVSVLRSLKAPVAERTGGKEKAPFFGGMTLLRYGPIGALLSRP
jgi:hypothetical protein